MRRIPVALSKLTPGVTRRLEAEKRRNALVARERQAAALALRKRTARRRLIGGN